MKERQQKEEARRLIESQKNKLVNSMQKLAESGLLIGEAEEMMLDTTGGVDGNQNLGSNEPLKDLFLGKRHPMIPYMSDNETKFFIVKAPNEDYLILGAH